jgi:uncharacterized OB-fold protein
MGALIYWNCPKCDALNLSNEDYDPQCEECQSKWEWIEVSPVPVGLDAEDDLGD